LLPSVPGEYQLLGSHALEGLPRELYPQRYVQEGKLHTEYPIIIAGDNFGCGSSREHAPIALGAAGGRAVVACSFARIFFRNCSSTGELYPWISKIKLIDHFKTGDEAVIDFGKPCIRNLSTGEEFELEPLGEVQPVIDAGGLFEYARRTGMIKSRPQSN
jgi:3-isopropylmalate/(R)-2-methylmalate dehydratase small subunit